VEEIMNCKREARRPTASLEQARNNPASLYNEQYYSEGYATGNDHAYGRNEPWTSFFATIARKITRKYKPETVADIGCAFGLLVEALCDQGVDAVGFDISPYAVSKARADIKDRLKVHSILDPIPIVDHRKYDLVICIEVLEHLPPEQAAIAVANLCAASDRVIFSSSPDDFDEPTHFNVLPTEKWLEMFAEYDFVPAKKPQADYVAKHAFVVEKRALQSGFLGRLFGW
jgi:2-polyprenyl-3-methyl-5-hydroxy-6-metoxy-1,4-benzoquinol methylase